MRTSITKNPAQHRIRRSLIALVAGCALLATAPGAALAAPVGTDSTGSTHSIAGKKKVKVEAKLDKGKVKVNEKVKLKGKLDVQASGADGVTSLEPLVVQRLVAGAWIDLTSTSCRPNGSYQLRLSFQVQAEIKLRVYHPETTLYASATSSVFSLLVI